MVTGIKLGDLASVSRLLASGLVPVDSTHKGASLLCLAVSSNNPDMVEVVMRAGADMNTQYSWQGATETPLIAAVRLGYEAVARSLTRSPATDLDTRDTGGRSALQWAVEARRPGLVRLLLGAGARLHAPCLHSAIRMSGYITGQEIAFLLIRSGAEVTECEVGDRRLRPLDWAVGVDSRELCEELLRVGARPADVPGQILDTASPGLRSLISEARRSVPSLEALARQRARASVAASHSHLSIETRISRLNLPRRISDAIL